MTFTITHRSGAMERDPPIEVMRSLVEELEDDDPEHPDVSVSHESGWTISAYPSGLVVWENAELDDEPRHRRDVPRREVLDLFVAVAGGSLEKVEAQDWHPGYG